MVRLFVMLFLFTAFISCIYTILQYHMSPFRAFLLATMAAIGISFAMTKLEEGLNIRASFGYNRNTNDFLQLDGLVIPQGNNMSFSGLQLRGLTNVDY